jgi:16S rRNA (guanine527-N7)-methyltransferase
MTPAAALELGVRDLGLSLPADAHEKLLAYLALLAKWNRTYNLTAIRNPQDMVSHHLLDSLAIIPHLPMPRQAASVADVGSGAGLPGIPLAVARPDWHVALNDSKQKKAAFMRQAVIEMGLTNVEVQELRVETWRPLKLFAVVVSRAFADLGGFIAACRHLVLPGGALVAMKGAAPRAELAGVPADCDCSSVIELSVPRLQAARHLVICRPRGAV